MFVTVSLLQEQRACEEQVAIFRAEWPDGTWLTPTAVQRAQELGLDIIWFVITCLPKLRGAYYEALLPRTAEWEKAHAPAEKAYYQALDEKGASNRAYNAYCDTMAEADAALRVAEAEALVAMLEREG